MSGNLPRIEPYCKQCDFHVWLKKLEMLIRMANIEEAKKVDFLMTNLDMAIFEAVVSTFTDDFEYDEVVKFLLERYSTQDKFLHRLDFFNVTFSGSFDEYASRLQVLYENFDKCDVREEMLIAKFLSTIPTSMSSELRIRRPKTLSECVQICNSLHSSTTNLCTAAVSRTKPNRNYDHPTNKNAFIRNNSDRKCFRCGSPGHYASDPSCPAKNSICHFCEKTGHFASVCKQRLASNTNAITNELHPPNTQS